jgi:outer membrane protein assembly factor BamB
MPAIWGESLYFGSTDGNVYSVEIKRGKLRWQFKTRGMVLSSPVVDNGIVYIGSTDHYLYALPA